MNTSRILRAAAFATCAHDGQIRKYEGGPYVLHCFRVAEKVARTYMPGSYVYEESIMAALLHDTLEDCPLVTREEILNQFGIITENLVWQLTDPPKEAGNRATRKAMTIERFRHAEGEAHTIKCADLIDNASSIVYNDPNFGPRFLKEKRQLLPVLNRAVPSIYKEAWDELDRLEQWVKDHNDAK